LHSAAVGYSSQGVSTDPEVEHPEANGEAPESGQAPASDPLAESEKRVAALKDQLLRTAADFDNYRKRSRRELEEATASGREGLLRDLLPVFDNLERATAHVDKASDTQALANGIDMVVRQFRDTLKKLGIERIVTLGQPFDPAVHEAIQQVETADVTAGSIAAEVQAGYRFGERLVRPAMVVVAKAPSAPSETVQ
jgi:molecular chaperone GrpE